MDRLIAGASIKGVLDIEALSAQLPQKIIRRLKRLPRMVLSLAAAACHGSLCKPQSIFFGTGWGPLSEAHDFLMKLFESGEQFTSPTDFIGAVHNAPAGQAAMLFGATGPNITVSGGDYSFEQALLTAGLLQHQSGQAMLLIGADEHHPVFTPLFEPDADAVGPSADGGAAFLLIPGKNDGLSIHSLYFADARCYPQVIPDMIDRLGGPLRIRDRYAAVFTGVAAAFKKSGDNQLQAFISGTGFEGAVVDYRRWTGEFASASAVAAFLAAQCIQHNEIPGKIQTQKTHSLSGRGILLLGLGEFVTAMEIMP